MNRDAFFKKKETIKALEDRRYLQDMLVLTQMIWVMQEKHKERRQLLMAYVLHMRYLRLQKRKIKKESFWYQINAKADHHFHEYKL